MRAGEEETFQFNETEVQRPIKKMSGVSNFTYLTSSPERRGLEKRDAGKIEYNVAGMQMKIAEIVKLGELPDKEEGAKASYKSYNTTNKLIHGMNQEAFFAENVQT